MNTKEKKSIRKILAILFVVVIFATIPVSTAFASGNARASTTTTKQTTVSGCKDDKHSMPTGDIGKWFSNRNELQTYVNSIIAEWREKRANGEITLEEYNKNAPTGYEAWSCAKCGMWTGNFKYRDVTEPSTSHTHTWDNGVVTKPATCTEKGVKTYTCNGCGESRTEAIAETGHKYVATVIKSTCTTSGKTIHKCSNCNSSYEDGFIEATGHDYRYVANNDGTHKKICKACSYTVSENCNRVKQGNYYVCSECSARYEDTKPTEPSTEPPTSHTHTWDNGIVTKPATCTEKGVKTYTCSGCGETRTEAIAETGHKYVATVIKPTCTTSGKTVYKCANCNSSYDADYIEATGHVYKYVANNDGTHKKVCNICSDMVIESCSKVKQDNSFICSYCKAVYDDATVTEPSTDPVTKPNPTEPSTNEPTKPSEPTTSPNESTTGKGNTDVTSALKDENKATTESENSTADSVNKNTDKKSPKTGAEIIDTGDNASMNIIILCASAVLIVLAVVLMLKAKRNNKSGKFEP